MTGGKNTASTQWFIPLDLAFKNEGYVQNESLIDRLYYRVMTSLFVILPSLLIMLI